MLRTRANTKLTAATLAVVALIAAPAPAARAETDEVRARTGFGAIADWISHAKLRPPSPGPFVPVVGKVDYGTADNAFGAARSGHVHSGQDMFAAIGTPLVAVRDAVVLDAGSDGGQGNYIHLYDPKRELTYVYMHMVEPTALDRGENVSAGERVGGVGCTGSCWGEHLHFEVRRGRGWTGEPLDPLPMLRDWAPLERPR
ncbi:MAG TPA: M23 family metallopeptidase [Solirubrobacterales bacterium]|nr:M23 family metallopeptidase [Solirubrobacterales bacterium]